MYGGVNTTTSPLLLTFLSLNHHRKADLDSDMATSLAFLNATGISSPSSGLIRRRRSHIVSRQDLPKLSIIYSSPRLSDSRNASSPIRSVRVRSQLNTPLISGNDEWGTWTALFATGAFGLWYGNDVVLRSHKV